jgi:hypothetical protein
MYTRSLSLLALWSLTVVGCGHDGSGGNDTGEDADMAANGNDLSSASSGGHHSGLPLVTPPVRAAAPTGFVPAPQGSKFRPLSLSADDLKSRFFMAGPTNIFNILQSIDDRLSGINQRLAAGDPSCMAQEAVPYTLKLPGKTVTAYAQCYDSVGSSGPDDPGLLQFGQKDGVTYLYQAIGQGQIAATVTPVVGDGGVSGDGGYQVDAWLSVGTLNASSSCGGHATWDGCSYGVIHLWADSSTKQLEMTVAGVGFGYCGAQLKSDGVTIYASGSTDMGLTCNAVDNLCVSAEDGTTPGDCSASTTRFDLPGLGRNASSGTSQSWGQSQFPLETNVALDGTSDDAVHFGPSAPSPGVGKLGG